MLRIKKNDKVMVIAGKDKGKTGKILHVFPKANRAIVENLNMVKKARRKTQQDQKGGISDIESPIHLSNIMLIDKKANKPTRFTIKTMKDGSKERISTKSGDSV